MQFDATIHLSDILIFVGGILSFLKVFLMMRDEMRDIANNIGKRYPREGLLGDVETIKEKVEEHERWILINDRRASMERGHVDLPTELR